MVTVHLEQNEVSVRGGAAGLLQPQRGCIWLLGQTLWRGSLGPIPIFCSLHHCVQNSGRRGIFAAGFTALPSISTSLLFSAFKNLLGDPSLLSSCYLQWSCSKAPGNSLAASTSWDKHKHKRWCRRPLPPYRPPPSPQTPRFPLVRSSKDEASGITKGGKPDSRIFSPAFRGGLKKPFPSGPGGAV